MRGAQLPGTSRREGCASREPGSQRSQDGAGSPGLCVQLSPDRCAHSQGAMASVQKEGNDEGSGAEGGPLTPHPSFAKIRETVHPSLRGSVSPRTNPMAVQQPGAEPASAAARAPGPASLAAETDLSLISSHKGGKPRRPCWEAPRHVGSSWAHTQSARQDSLICQNQTKTFQPRTKRKWGGGGRPVAG